MPPPKWLETFLDDGTAASMALRGFLAYASLAALGIVSAHALVLRYWRRKYKGVPVPKALQWPHAEVGIHVSVRHFDHTPWPLNPLIHR